jgi:hypothetical protein
MKKESHRKDDAIAVPKSLRTVVAALERTPGVSIEKGWGSSSITLKAQGKILALVQGDRLVVKLPKARVDSLVEASEGVRSDPRHDGRLMREWVVLAKHRARWGDLTDEALRFVAGKTR